MNKKMSRRDFLRLIAGAAGIAGIGLLGKLLSGKAKIIPHTGAPGDHQVWMPAIFNKYPPIPPPTPTPIPTHTPTPTPTPTQGATPPPGNNRVVHVWDPDATNWNFSTSTWYGNYVNQQVVDEMTNQGIMTLTGQSTVSTAWQSLLPGYSAGKAIAIKVNFNNTGGNCDDSDNQIDAIAEPVISLINGMIQAGVQQQDIWIYDALRRFPTRFLNKLVNYQYVQLFDNGRCSSPAAGFTDTPTSRVNFNYGALTWRLLTDVLANCTYLINVPIMKDHGISPVTLGFKNHYGSIHQVIGPNEELLHELIDPNHSNYDPNYSPLVVLNYHPYIREKTVLVVGDGLFGALGLTHAVPTRWASFNNDSPNSLFFSRDPVAIDCVMFDVLDADPAYHPKRGEHEDDYLKRANQAGMGTYERADPWLDTYTLIDYIRVER
jgi:hypothetical protein